MLKKKFIIGACLLVTLLAGSSAWAAVSVGSTQASSCTLTTAGITAAASTTPNAICCQTNHSATATLYWLLITGSNCPAGTQSNSTCGASTEVATYTMPTDASAGVFTASTDYASCTD